MDHCLTKLNNTFFIHPRRRLKSLRRGQPHETPYASSGHSFPRESHDDVLGLSRDAVSIPTAGCFLSWLAVSESELTRDEAVI